MEAIRKATFIECKQCTHLDHEPYSPGDIIYSEQTGPFSYQRFGRHTILQYFVDLASSFFMISTTFKMTEHSAYQNFCTFNGLVEKHHSRTVNTIVTGHEPNFKATPFHKILTISMCSQMCTCLGNTRKLSLYGVQLKKKLIPCWLLVEWRMDSCSWHTNTLHTSTIVSALGERKPRFRYFCQKMNT